MSTTTAAPAQSEIPIPIIMPESVKMNSEGFCFAEYFVRLPKGFTADMLKEPSAWARVQASPKVSLKRFDRLLMVSFDEDWIATAFVAGATRGGVTLSKPNISTFEPRTEILLRTAEFAVSWTGDGYSVIRNSDGAEMCGSVQAPEVAERNLRNLYSKAA